MQMRTKPVSDCAVFFFKYGNQAPQQNVIRTTVDGVFHLLFLYILLFWTSIGTLVHKYMTDLLTIYKQVQNLQQEVNEDGNPQTMNNEASPIDLKDC